VVFSTAREQVMNTLNKDKSCFLCESNTENQHGLCQHCYQRLPRINKACQCCGLPIAEQAESIICAQCIKTPPQYQRSFIPMQYTFPIDKMIQQLKFQKHLNHLPLFSTLLVEYIEHHHTESLPEFLIPVPLHPSRIRQRGFNQAAEICKKLAYHFNIKWLKTDVSRTRKTLTQSEMDASQRRKNMRHAFHANKLSNINHVAIIDDVVTTGSTANSLATTLQQAGITKIEVWAIARALKTT
jgi:ComF family protein